LEKCVTDRYAKLCEDVAFRKAQAERVGIGFNLELVPQCPPTSVRATLRKRL